MQASDLVTVWSAPDNSRLTSKQYSFRLPVHVAAKLAALEELYPSRSRTQLVGDLLSAALTEVEKNLPTSVGEFIDNNPDNGKPMHKASGPRAIFRKSADMHYAEIERDMGNEAPEALYGVDLFVYDDNT